MTIRPTIRQLEYLLAVKREGSFLAASQSCNVTQSTLSAGIKELESILGQTLVLRARGNVHLTDLGEEITGLASTALTYIDGIVSTAKFMQDPLSGRLRLGVIPTIAPYFLPRLLPFLHAEFPDLQLELHEDLSERLVDQLHKRQIDAAIMALPYDTGRLETHTLFKEPFYLAAHTLHDPEKQIHINDLSKYDLLLLEDGHCLRDHAMSACHLPAPTRRKSFSATSLATLIQMVGHGYGATLLPEMVVKHGALPKTVAVTGFTAPIPTRDIGIAWMKNSPYERDVLELLGALRDFQDIT